MIEFELPDGTILEFPDSVGVDAAKEIVRQKYGKQQAPRDTGMAETISALMPGGSAPPVTLTTEQAGDHLKTWGPVAGAIAAPLVAPTIGAAGTAGTVGKTVYSGLDLLLKALSAGAGGGGASYATERIAGTPHDEALPAAGGVAAGSMIGEGIGGFATKALGPMLKSGMKWGMGKGPWGDFIQKRVLAQYDELQNEAVQRGVKYLDDIAPDLVKAQQSGVDDLGVKVTAALDEAAAVYKKYEGVLREAADETGEVALPNVAKHIQTLTRESDAPVGKILREMGYKPNGEAGSIVKKIINTGKATPDEVMFVLNNIYKKGGKKSAYQKMNPTHKGHREKLKDAFMGDIEVATGAEGASAGALKAEADAAWKSINRFKFVRQIFSRGLKYNSKTNEPYILPGALSKTIYDRLPHVKKYMPELYDGLKREADYYAEIAPRMKSIKVGKDFDLFAAWGSMNPKDKEFATKVLRPMLTAAGVLGKPAFMGGMQLAGKTAGMHMAGQPVEFGQ
jgi:hypothetical protein